MKFTPIVAALSAGIVSQIVSVQEPTLPDEWVQTFEVRCGADRLRIRGYGAKLPGRRGGPTIEANGAQIGGSLADALRRDLSNQRAAYRLTGQCLPANGGISLSIYSGEMTYPGERPPGRMEYHAGMATVSRGRIAVYSGLEASNEETFWFR